MLSKWLRRIHMYAAMFLIPWVLMYAVSTMVMNHHREGDRAPDLGFVTERETTYGGTFPDQATRKEMADQILDSLGLSGRFRVGKPQADGALVITRHSPMWERRITFEPASGRLRVERAGYDGQRFWNQIHRRRGYDADSAKEDAWGLSVDVFIFTMVFWIASGLWMWWELRTTRRWGVVALLGGSGLFVFFLVAI